MTDNLFISAMGIDKANEIDLIKSNKAFALRIISDLNQVFRTYHKVEDEQNSVTIRTKTSDTSNWYGSFSFIANAKGIKFNGHNLGYYSNSTFKPLGKIYEKYKETSTTDTNFLDEKSNGHGYCFISFFISENDPLLMDKLNDIVYLMEQNQYRKVF
jgi:hypothetical protein